MQIYVPWSPTKILQRASTRQRQVGGMNGLGYFYTHRFVVTSAVSPQHQQPAGTITKASRVDNVDHPKGVSAK